MKKCTLLLLLFPCWISAQNTQIMKAVSGEELSTKVSAQMQYLFPEFTGGEVYFKSYTANGSLNYNMLVGEMQFMENDQVLALDNLKDVVMLRISSRRFYPFNDREFTEELLSTGKYQLRVRRKGTVTPQGRKGAYGTYSSAGSITAIGSYSSYNGNSTSITRTNLSVEDKVLINLDCFYYLVGTNGKHIQIKNVKTFTKQFPAHRKQIEAFVIEQNIRYNNEDDLKTLLEYCSKLD